MNKKILDLVKHKTHEYTYVIAFLENVIAYDSSLCAEITLSRTHRQVHIGNSSTEYDTHEQQRFRSIWGL